MALSSWVGFTWWSLGLTIAVALAVGYALHLGDSVLEVPISAMLILSVDTHSAGTWRIVETLVGTGAGLMAGLVFARPRVQAAAEAIEELCRKMADLLEQMADSLQDGSVLERPDDWLVQARSLERRDPARGRRAPRGGGERPAEPARLRLPYAAVSLRSRLETLEHAAIAIRMLARSLADSVRLAGEDSPMRDPEPRGRLAGVLRQLAAAVRVYGRLAATQEPDRQREPWRPSWNSTWPRPRSSRTSSARCCAPIPRPSRSAGRCGESWSAISTGSGRSCSRDMPEGRTPHRRARSWRRPLQAGRWRPRSPSRRRQRR